MDKLIITVATTGAVTTRKETPYLPISPQEIADEVLRSHEAGAAVAHIHVRELDGTPSMNFGHFTEVVERVRSRCDIVLCLTSSGGLNLKEEDRLRVCELRPELVSYDSGSMNFGPAVFINSPPFLEKLAAKAQEHGVKPEIEVFETGFINNAMVIAKKGLINPPFHFQFVLGVPGGMPASPKNLLHLYESIPGGSTWSTIGIGRHQLPTTTMGMIMGGHVRVGMEDNVFLDRTTLAKSNAEFVERAVRLAREFGRDIATSAEARAMLGVSR